MNPNSSDFSDTDSAPEVPSGMEQVVAWDEAPADSGVHIKAVVSADEADASPLVEEGIAEADRELRVADEATADGEVTDDDTAPPTTGILS